ncbi:hypothetical protein GCM10010277_42810 [Streptomyces longisporoflavus]|uniref:hypothetical protein n=1 Tax=Streptomyces longisporoflavus TaxID=28044 RepID=UPI00167E026F|nr:hypothetical protein [Streptomyces longisporoflavus]GGV49174.1 hypothetical protein GCM10010277_42810 [Streptomyces longisporoflavus]
MTDLIRRLTAWARLLLAPSHAPMATAPAPPVRPDPQPATPRSRYGLDSLLPLAGEATRPVRPYLTAHEQLSRRRELLLATFGVDAPGPYWIHGMEIA